MRKIIAFLLLMGLPFFSISKITDSIRINALDYQIEEIDKKNKELSEKLELYNDLHSKSLDGISGQISASANNIAIFSILFGVFGILLALFVAWMERRTLKIFKQAQQTKSEINEINELIQNDLTKLNEKLRREDTILMLQRLVEVPEDIGNQLNLLLVRKLENDDFLLIKQAYNKLLNSSSLHTPTVQIEHFQKQYIILFFQFFVYQSLSDKEIRDGFEKHAIDCINCAFDNDIKKSTEDFMKYYNSINNVKRFEELGWYLNSVFYSKFKLNEDIYEIVYFNLKSRNEKFQLYNNFLKDTSIQKAIKYKLKSKITKEFNFGTLNTWEASVLKFPI